uniref:EF-hand domain-containing protein n=1 Tax=Macrostomum lignano TaxID=282301 RepID=A0A1I8FFJ2_9PLAT
HLKEAQWLSSEVLSRQASLGAASASSTCLPSLFLLGHELLDLLASVASSKRCGPTHRSQLGKPMFQCYPIALRVVHHNVSLVRLMAAALRRCRLHSNWLRLPIWRLGAFDSHRRGFLQFRASCGHAMEEPRPHGSTPAELRCRYIFRTYDEDCDGCLSFSRVRAHQRPTRKRTQTQAKPAASPGSTSER